MPGSWELKQNNAVLVAILHTDTTSIAWALGLRNLIVPGQIIALAGMPFDHARNVAAMRALESRAEYLFFLDSDVVPPHNTILRLLAHNKPIISALYCRRSPPAGVPVMIKNGMWVTQFPPNAVIEVDLVGAGCLLIHRQILEKLPPSRPEHGKHWFDWKVDMAGILPPSECLSEDFSFCLNVKKHLGIPILVDTSIQCRHIGFSEAGYGTLQPCEARPAT